MTDNVAGAEQAQESEPGFWGKLWNFVENVFSFSWFGRKYNDVKECAKDVAKGDWTRAGASLVGAQNYVDIGRDNTMGPNEKSLLRTQENVKQAAELVSTVAPVAGTEYIVGGVRVAGNLYTQRKLESAREKDDTLNFKKLKGTIKDLTLSDWLDLRDQLDNITIDGRVDQQEFDTSYARLDVNKDGKVDDTDMASIGSKDAAFKLMIGQNSGRA